MFLYVYMRITCDINCVLWNKWFQNVFKHVSPAGRSLLHFRVTDTDHGTAVLAAVAVVVSLLSWEQMSGAVPLRLGGVGPREALQGWAPGVSGCGLLITDSCINDNSRAFLITDSCIKDNSKAF